MKELQYLNKYFIKYKFRFLIGITITIASQIFSLYTPKLISKSITAIENFNKNGGSSELIKNQLFQNIMWILITTLIAGTLRFLMRQTLIVMSRHVEFDLKNEIFKHYEVLDQKFYKQNRTGDLMNRISEDVAKVRQYVGPALMYTINTLISFIVVIIYMFNVSPILTLYTVVPLPILAFIVFKLSKEINTRSTLFQNYLSTVFNFTQEIFSGIRVVKAYTLEKQYSKSLIAIAAESKSKSLDLARVQSLLGPLMIALIGISNLVVIYFGGMMYINGTIKSIGTIAEFILYVNMLTWPVTSIGWVSSLIQEAEASQKRINAFLKIEPAIKNNRSEKSKIQGEIEFEGVTFTYEETQIKAIDNLTFKVKKGETLAILGSTGSGKSTVLNLITRLYDIDKGTIKIDGDCIANLNLSDLRNSVGFVPQDAFLFSDSIKNNIKFGNELATDEAIVDVAKEAMVHDNIVAFKNQYETILGERGITLSGGQKQRISIARALLKSPKILLLDDCLSAVDTATEEQILNNLSRITKDKTTIIVSHRVSSIKNANYIIVLDQGQIIEEGTHTQLINIGGYYADLYLKQLSEKDLN
jgi:ATP-binding cassette subfamily B protein